MFLSSQKRLQKALEFLQIVEKDSWLIQLSTDEQKHLDLAILHLSELIASMARKNAITEDKEVA